MLERNTQTNTQPVAAPKSRLLRFWSDAREPYTDGHIRIEWIGKGGVTRTSAGRYYIDDNCVVWDYEEPPNRVYNDAIECAGSAGDFTVAGVEFAGRETYEQMCAAVESTCCGCGSRVEGPDLLSRDGECARCWTAAMASCTKEDHDLTVKHAWDSLVNPRPWPAAELQIAECPLCNSTLASEDRYQRTTAAVDEAFAAVRAEVVS